MKQLKPSLALIVGFDPFGNLKANPSQLAVELLAKNLHVDDQIKKAKGKINFKILVLPTSSKKAWAKLKPNVEKIRNQKYVLVLSGYAQTRKNISIERFALNVQDYRIADNQGIELHSEYILRDAPDALRTNCDITYITKALSKKGYKCEVSNHAGTFICNEIYYRALASWQKDKNCQAVIFVHLPFVGKKKQSAIKTYANCLQEIAYLIIDKKLKSTGKS